jgi:threonine dehydratase
MTDAIVLQDVYAARQRIASLALRTPLVRSFALEGRTNAPVYMKLESVQMTGAFKLRGAANKILGLSDAEKARGVVTVSSGNHGRAVSYVAGQSGVSAIICLADNVPANKVEGIRRYGAHVEIAGSSYDEAEAHAVRLQRERGLTYVSSYDDAAVIAGQGTIGLEILEDLPGVDTVVVPLSGGGLIGGIALAMKAANPGIRMIGVSMERAPVMYHSLKAGRVLTLPEEPTLADALVGGLGEANTYSFDLCRRLLDDAVLVSEDEIARAMAFMLETHHLVVEGGGAVGIAALLSGKIEAGRQTAVVVSGGNVDVPLLLDIAQRYGREG